MVQDRDPITALGMDYGCVSCGSKTDQFYFVEYYMLPSKFVRKRHHEKERFALYCCSCYEAHNQLHVEVDGKPLTIAKAATPDLNSLRCIVCSAEIPPRVLYGVVTSLLLMDGSGIESKPLAFLCSECVEKHTLEF